jgi:Xaa-Pro aminopeptidase
MYQSFAATTRPEDGPPRLAALREALAEARLTGFLVPRADAHQGEYVAPHDDRLAWLTGFTGSAGFCIVLPHTAGLFVDGRYRVQARAQASTDHFAPVAWPDTRPADWLREQLPNGGVIGFDPWLHTTDEIEKLRAGLTESGVTLSPVENPIDRIWPDQPSPPCGTVRPHPLALAGEAGADKRARLAEMLRQCGQRAAVLTLPDSICWLTNLRGSDVPRNPVIHAFGLLHDDARLTLFMDDTKLGAAARAHLDDEVTLRPVGAFAAGLRSTSGPVRVDRATAPVWVAEQLTGAGIEVAWGQDPCILPKARKNAAELDGCRAAHLRDGAAMVEFLAWLDRTAPDDLTEIDVVRTLEGYRAADPALLDISFDTICGMGPNGAIVHYRATEATNRPISAGGLLLIDSGGQYADGTTDVTRTIAIGDPDSEMRTAFTRVLQGMIAISRARWPKGCTGRDLDPLARYHLWLAGQDYDHGTGHGVGAALSVHEGPQRISRASEVVLEPGMILSNEPGYYREDEFGIRIENLVVVGEAPELANADARPMLSFETLTWVPIDRRLIEAENLSASERDWLNGYHAEVQARLSGRVSAEASAWLAQACAPI